MKAIVVVCDAEKRVRMTVRGDLPVARLVAKYAEWAKSDVTGLESAASGGAIAPDASVSSLDGQEVRAVRRRRVGIKGALAARTGRWEAELKALASAYPSTCGLRQSEEKFLLDLYACNEHALNRTELLRYVSTNTSAAAALETLEPLLPKTARSPRRKVSVVVPTTHHRAAFHETLYACFCWQTHEPRELVILDTGVSASPFFEACEDPRVRYSYEPDHPPSTGAKRNTLIDRATGEVVAHFDDDDFYGPHYLSRLLDALGEAELATLGSWTWLDAERFRAKRDHDCVSWYDASRDQRRGFSENHAAAGWHSRKWGYGFSYVYRRDVPARFPNAFLGEDYDFCMRLLATGATCRAFRDDPDDAVVLHVMHNNNSSIVARHRDRSLADLDRAFQHHPLVNILTAMRDRHVFDTTLSDTLRRARAVVPE
ncbi:hypothetical protein CTAYLR_002661 [Chrysophaeum taylorii]|uniref:Glycosyltransferase 2-like domain-containing protein n=1 Tax=Chrysophaeum taylorii TaxID=2483200 RepID=A0AAD7UE39_9STRA|nr:hypothetical protein CTAYLR_002661 [Chrysophaeum taylorii]